MGKLKYAFIASSLSLGMAFAVVAGANFKQTSEVAAAPQTATNFVLIGDGIKHGGAWTWESSKPMKEIASGVYIKTVYAQYGQICVAEYGNWGNAFGFNDLEVNDTVTNGKVANAQDYNCSDPNVFVTGSWGYYKFTLDTNKDEKPLTVDLVYAGNAPTIAGPGVASGSWDCNHEDYIFETDDCINFYRQVTTVANGSWRIVGLYTGWTTYADARGLQSSPYSSDFTDTGDGDHNFKSLTSQTYVVKFNLNTGKTWFYGVNEYHDVYYVEGKTLLAKDMAAHNVVFSPETYYSSDVNKRWFGYYTNEALTVEYEEVALTADLVLYGDYREYSYYMYFASGPDWGWPNGANIYAWDSNGQVTSNWPGNQMTWLGAGLYSYKFVGEQRPTGFKFSETNNVDNNQTGDVAYTDGTNLYIYESNTYHLLTEAMIKAELFSEQFINDTAAACTAENVTSEVWGTTKTHAADVLADESALAIMQAGKGVFDDAGLNDWVKKASARYDHIVKKYGYENYLTRDISGIQLNESLAWFGKNANSVTITIVVISIAALTSLAIVTIVIVRKKHKNI